MISFAILLTRDFSIRLKQNDQIKILSFYRLNWTWWYCYKQLNLPWFQWNAFSENWATHTHISSSWIRIGCGVVRGKKSNSTILRYKSWPIHLYEYTVELTICRGYYCYWCLSVAVAIHFLRPLDRKLTEFSLYVCSINPRVEATLQRIIMRDAITVGED